jgi:diacylglycerol kinase family enzyme
VRSVLETGEAIARATTTGPLHAVVAAGGDGTVNLVARALLEHGVSPSSPALGVLPLGTGNAFAAGLGIRSLRTAIRTLGGRNTTFIDVMRTTHPAAPLALVSLSTGFEARLIRHYDMRRARWTRTGAAVAAAVFAGWRAQGGVRLVADGAVLADPTRPTFNAGLYNTPCYGFGLTPWPDAQPADGRGEAVVFRAGTQYWRIVAGGVHTAAPCDVRDPCWLQWQRATLETQDVLQVDGELLPPAEIEVSIAHAALRVLAPPDTCSATVDEDTTHP